MLMIRLQLRDSRKMLSIYYTSDECRMLLLLRRIIIIIIILIHAICVWIRGVSSTRFISPSYHPTSRVSHHTSLIPHWIVVGRTRNNEWVKATVACVSWLSAFLSSSHRTYYSDQQRQSVHTYFFFFFCLLLLLLFCCCCVFLVAGTMHWDGNGESANWRRWHRKVSLSSIMNTRVPLANYRIIL